MLVNGAQFQTETLPADLVAIVEAADKPAVRGPYKKHVK
jgi:hypothetical protein